MDVKAFLDAELFGKLLHDRPHHLRLVSLIKSPSAILVWMETDNFPEDVLGLLEAGARLDYFRNPEPVSPKMVLFGSDGLPSIERVSGGAWARARALWAGSPDLIIDVRSPAAPAAALGAVRSFYDLAKERHGVESVDIMKHFGPTQKSRTYEPSAEV